MSFDADLGPVNVVVVRFPTLPIPASGFDLLDDLVSAGRVNVLDIEFVSRSADGAAIRLDAGIVGLETLAGADSHLIDEDDIATAATELADGEVAAIVVYEDLTFLPVIGRWAADGGSIITEGPVPVDDLIGALDATEGN